MHDDKVRPKVFVIVGSTRPGRIGRAIAEWYIRLAEKHHPEIRFELVDLAVWDLPMLNEPMPAKARNYQHSRTKQWSTKVGEADGYIIVTPEYNHGYPASLKNALDYLYHEWNGKPAVLIGYSWSGGRHVIEQLRHVVSELGMAPLSRHIPIFLRPDMLTMQRQLINPDSSLAEYVNEAAQITDSLAYILVKGVEHEPKKL